MGRGGSKLFRVDAADKIDPRIAGRAGQRGTLFRLIPDVGDCVLLVKQDNGFSTNWTPVSGSSVLPTAVSAASVANVNIAVAPATIDGVPYVVALLKDQALPEENGVYDFNGAGNPLTRNSGWDEAIEFVPGREVFVQDGNTQADTLWVNELAVTNLGVDPIEFQEIPNSGFMLKDFSNSIPATKDQDFGNHKLINVILVDGSSIIQNTVDGTKTLNYDLSGSAPGTQITVASLVTASRIISVPDITGTVLVSTPLSPGAGGQVFINATGPTVGSNAGIQLNSDVANRGQIRGNQYGNHNGIAGITGFKSRGATIGALASVLAGDVLCRMTAIGVTGNNTNIPNAGYVSLQVPAAGVFATWVASEFVVTLTSLAGVQADKLKLSSEAALFFGNSSTGGAITSSGSGALAHGDASGSGTISATGIGSVAHGNATTSGSITASGIGAFAGGYSSGATTNITASGRGSLAFGDAPSFAITVSGFGSFALGSASGGGGNISVGGDGSFMGGINSTGALTSTQSANFSWGDDLVTSCFGGQTFGRGHRNNTQMTAVFGRYSVTPAAGNENSFVATDPLFVLGNGASNVSRANAYQIDKDGRQITTASHVDQGIRLIAAASAISARTDYAVVCDTTGVSGNLTLPAGEKGLEFVFTSAGAGAAVYTLVPNGGDLLDVSVVSIIATGVISRIKFLAGTWYAV